MSPLSRAADPARHGHQRSPDRSPGWKTAIATGVLAALVILLAGSVVGGTPDGTALPAEQAEPALVVEDATVAPGQEASVPVVLTQAPDGLAGYDLTLTIDGESGASFEDATYPDAFGLTTDPVLDADGQSVTVEAADLDDEIAAGAEDVALATIEVSPPKSGDIAIQVTDAKVDADDGSAIDVRPDTGTVSVERAGDGRSPGSSGGPTDQDDSGSANSRPDDTGSGDDESVLADEVPGFGPLAAVLALCAVAAGRSRRGS
ncbi:hypothetical protein [Halovivax limisalsi]|uniref:hypothetical protein n=1 Tax=Halovivax limisalsi TaxID=1453760 RepID=UPI001FFDC216|nr:hypothetical protein [Halovivax limisalsi]